MREILIKARKPFDFSATARFLRFTEAEIVDTFSDGRYARALHLHDGKLYLMTIEAREANGRAKNLTVKLSAAGGHARVSERASEEAARIARNTFSLDHDLHRFRNEIAGDALMSELEAAHRGLRLARWTTLFEALTTNILCQQIATTVAMIFKRRMVERFGERIEKRGATFYAFPTPASLAAARTEDLRALGLTGAKTASLMELARADVDGALDAREIENADNETAISRLTRLRGVGRWTAEWSLVLYFGRTDVFPAGDLALRNAVANHYFAGTPQTEATVREFARASWGAWGAYAALYLIAGFRAGKISFRRPRVLSSESSDARVSRARRSRTKAIVSGHDEA